MVNKKQLAAALTNLATKESLDDKENQPLLRPQSRYPKRKMNVKNEPTDNTEPSQSKLTPLNDVSIKNEPQIKHEEVAQTSAYFSKQTNDAESDSKKAKWEPSLWKEQFARIRKMRSSHDAPVDTSGCDSLANSSAKTPQDKRFCVLVSLMLSAQTKDEVTARAVRELEKLPLNIETMIATDEEIISKAIYPVSFYKRKAQYIKKTAQMLKDEFNGDIPESVEGLCKLPGVGPKMAYLAMSCGWDQNVGIGVDTHVHRISQRIGWTRGLTKSPEHTRKELEDWLPQAYWQEVNHLLVGFGQQICRPVGPKCGECLCNDICPKIQPKSPVRKSKASVKIEKDDSSL